MKYFYWIVIVFVVAAIVLALFLVGSPSHQRATRMDERRLNDLRSLQNQIQGYFYTNEKLPITLEDLKGYEGYYGSMNDPETGTIYEYKVKEAMRFELCANFSLPSEEASVSILSSKKSASETYDSWKHGAGRACFKVTLKKSPSGSSYPTTTIKPAI